MTNEVKKIMYCLGCTEEEALDVIECDKRIDKGEKLFELDESQKKVEKAMKRAPRKVATVDAYGKATTREKKADNDKGALMEILSNALEDKVENFTIVNAERELEFTFNGRKFKVVLSAPRS